MTRAALTAAAALSFVPTDTLAALALAASAGLGLVMEAAYGRAEDA